MACGCGGNKKIPKNKSSIGFRSVPTSAPLPSVVRATALNIVASNQNTGHLSTQKRELERKRREAILKRQGKL